MGATAVAVPSVGDRALRAALAAVQVGPLLVFLAIATARVSVVTSENAADFQ